MRIVWLTGVVTCVLFAGLAWYLSPLEPSAVALQLSFSPRAFAQVAHAWSPEQMQRYRSHLPVDFILLAFYGSFGYLLVSRSALFAGRTRWLRKVARWALPLAAVFDAAENSFHWWLTEVPRLGVVFPYVASGVCSTLKWAFVLIFVLAIVWALVRAEG